MITASKNGVAALAESFPQQLTARSIDVIAHSEILALLCRMVTKWLGEFMRMYGAPSRENLTYAHRRAGCSDFSAVVRYLAIFSLLVSRVLVAQDCTATVGESRSSVVYIHVRRANSGTGAVSERDGTGFVVSSEGVLFTSRSILPKTVDPALVEISGSIASRESDRRVLDFLASSEFGDVAILRFRDTSRNYKPVELGNSFATTVGQALCSMSFPSNVEFQLRSGTVSGKNAPNGWWYAEMSSGPGEEGAPVFDRATGQLLGSIRLRGNLLQASDATFVVPINLANPALSAYAGLMVKQDAASNVLGSLRDQASSVQSAVALQTAQTALLNAKASLAQAQALSPGDKETRDKEGEAQVSGASWLDDLWPNPNVYVCWENPEKRYGTEITWIRAEIAATWEHVSRLRFVGWQRCPMESRGLRVKLEESDDPLLSSQTKAFGRELDGDHDGIIINISQCPDIKAREICLKGIAGHVFGHAIGLHHTQDHADAPPGCRDQFATGPVDGPQLTPYDPKSIMNYCNPVWNNNGALSEWDIALVQKLYGT